MFNAIRRIERLSLGPEFVGNHITHILQVYQSFLQSIHRRARYQIQSANNHPTVGISTTGKRGGGGGNTYSRSEFEYSSSAQTGEEWHKRKTQHRGCRK